MKKKFLFVCFLLTCNLSANIFASDYCAKKVTIDPNYSKLQKQIEKIETELANNKIIASKADKILSGLITQKSPTITSWIQKRNLDPSKDEEKIIRQWRQYFLKDFIFRAYPVSEPDVDQLVEKHFNHINQLVYTKKNKSRLIKLFEEAQKLTLKKLELLSIPPEIKKNLLADIKKISLYWMDDFKTSKFSKFPMEFIDWGIAYDPSRSEINFGINALSYPNDETFIAVFIHEMAHAFDPCHYHKSYTQPYPFNKIIDCLRKNVQAKPRDDSQMDHLISKGKLTKEMVSELKANPFCNKSNYPPIGIQQEQINETFADWFSSEVIKDSKYQTLNLRTDLCVDSKLIEGSSYLTNQERLEYFFLTQSAVGKTALPRCDMGEISGLIP